MFLMMWILMALGDDGEAMANRALLDRDAAEYVVVHCERADPAHTNVDDVEWMQRLAVSYGAPRDILTSAWCWEAGMRSSDRHRGPLRGDWTDANGWRAHGPFQLHGWFRHWCKMAPGDADDVRKAAACYLSRIRYMRARVDCGEASWQVAEALTANAPRYVPWRCRAKSEHWRMMETWAY